MVSGFAVLERRMRAAQFQRPFAMQVLDQPLRALREDEVAVQIAACGVCGTDVHIFAGEAHARPPVILGHEFAGTIAEVGTAAHDWHVGDKVAVDPNIACGSCYYCRRGQVNFCENLRALGVDIDGGFAEYCLAPRQQCYALPSDFPPEYGTFAEPLSCCVHGMDRIMIQPGESVAIVGAGNIGLLMLQLARLAGAGSIFVLDPIPSKRELAEKLGADFVLDAGAHSAVNEIAECTHGGCDVALECAGRVEAAEMAMALTKRGSRVLLFGLASPSAQARLPLQTAFRKELSINASILNPFTFQRAVDLLAHNKIKLSFLSIHRFALDQITSAIESAKQGAAVKTLVLPHTSHVN
jgi:threonine dehydrogenase-like Zn-dependent dehydrogenase